MDEQQYREQMDDWLVRELDAQRAVMAPPKPKPSQPASPHAVMIFPLAVLWMIGLGIIGIVNDQTSASTSSAIGGVTPAVLIFCGLISWAWVSCVRRSNQVAAAKIQPTGRLILMPGDTAPAGTKVWVPDYRKGSVPGTWELYRWHPVTVGLNGAYFYEDEGLWYPPTSKKRYQDPEYNLAQTAGWVAAGLVVANHVHEAHVRHDARIFADELDKRRRRQW